VMVGSEQSGRMETGEGWLETVWSDRNRAGRVGSEQSGGIETGEGGLGTNSKKGNIEGGLRIVRNDGNKRRE
jgi:hypothetical protein